MKKAFTLLEIMIVLAIMGIVIGSVLVSSSAIRRSNRDAKRVADVSSIRAALADYYKVFHRYPLSLTAGEPLASTSPSLIFLSSVPSNPQPVDGDCSAATSYAYLPSADGSDYTINFCLGGRVGDWGSGFNSLSSETETTCVPDCVRSCGAGSDGCGGSCSVSACGAGETCVYDHCIRD
ncbi:MAG TPA: type II secretion system protein [bacterium]|nr:type II secretion system protein [bacterium]